MAFTFLHSRDGTHGIVAGRSDLDVLLESGRAESDPTMRDDIYRGVEELVRARAVLLLLFHDQAYRFSLPEVDGFEIRMALPMVPYEKLWVRSS